MCKPVVLLKIAVKTIIHFFRILWWTDLFEIEIFCNIVFTASFNQFADKFADKMY